jgi:hypothetical protein
MIRRVLKEGHARVVHGSVANAAHPAADLSIESIGDLLGADIHTLFAPSEK